MTRLVSVVMPVRDAERYVGDAVESILAQTHRDFELVVVDDGSVDGTPERLRRFADSRVRVLAQPRDGLVAALQRGLAASSGPYVARMDADDHSEPERLERQLDLLERSPRVGMVATWTTVVDEAGRVIGEEVLPTGHEDLHRRLLLRNPFTHGSVVLRREALEPAGGYRTDWGANEDYDLWRRLAGSCELACVPQALYRRRIHADAVTRTDPERTQLRERLRAEIWRAYPTSRYRVRETIQAGRDYRLLDERVFRDHVADQRALAREAVRRRRLTLAARAVGVSVAFGWIYRAESARAPARAGA